MRLASITLLLMTIVSTSFAQVSGNAPDISLYPDGVINAKPTPTTYVETTSADIHISKVSNPTLIPFFPEKGKANGTAVVICPGGGYGILAAGHEGVAVAKEFNKIGVTAFILKYRLPSDQIMNDKAIGPLQDAQTGIMIVRKRASEWGINPNKIGILGFSAGGHLASTAGTHFNKPVIDNKGISVRPDFMILAYPVITFGDYAHRGSQEALLGKGASKEQIDLYSNELQVTSDTPPTFIMHATDDGGVPVKNALLMYEALVKNKVKAEMHLFQNGGHGFGLINSKSKELWFDWCVSWLSANGLADGSGILDNYGNGGSLNMSQRSFTSRPKLNDDGRHIGKVVVELRVDKDGNVVYARAGARGTTIVDADLLKKCEDAVRNARLTAAGTALQSGNVVFVFNGN